MTDPRLTIEAANDFLDAYPSVQWIDAFLFDMNGIPRGKRLRRPDLLSVVKNGLMLPTSIFIMDPLGNCIEETGRLWETGDPDQKCHLLAGSLAPVPLGDGKHAQVVMVADGGGELDPRSILAAQVRRFGRKGWTPVVAVELEFYVTKRSDAAFVLETPEGLSNDPDRPLTFGFEELDTLGPFIDDVYRVCELHNLPIDAVMQESGPGQFEINLKHRADALGAALDALLLKRVVKAAAKAHGLEATFMAKPHQDWAGSGMHVHLSLFEGDRNVFAGDPISPVFRHALGGMRQTMADFMAVWAQSANAYRRYVPKSYVSMTAQWGFNNRTVALRIPHADADAAMRIEHRIAGADANPYLVVASILAGIWHGIEHNIDAGEAVEGDSETIEAAKLPTCWTNALDAFQSSSVVREAFGAQFQDVFSRLKQAERCNFERMVTPLDHLWYARVA